MELLISIIIGLVTVELYAWLPKLVDSLLERAVCALPESDQERCREEWKANLAALPNTLLRAIHAFSFLVNAHQIERERVSEILHEADVLLGEVILLERKLQKDADGIRESLARTTAQLLSAEEKRIGALARLERAVTGAEAKAADQPSTDLREAVRRLAAAIPGVHASFKKRSSVSAAYCGSIKTRLDQFDLLVSEWAIFARRLSGSLEELRFQKASSGQLEAVLEALYEGGDKLLDMTNEHSWEVPDADDLHVRPFPTFEWREAFAAFKAAKAQVQMRK